MKRLLWLLPLLPGVAQSLEIRGYTAAPSTYDRFVDFSAQPPVLNTSAWYSNIGNQFTGLGWANGNSPNQRQPALVSPRHVLLPSHWLPANGTTISFLSASGNVITRTLESAAIVRDTTPDNPNTPENENMGTSDLTLGRLNEPLPESEVRPFPYGSVAGGTNLYVFGFHAKAGNGTVHTYEVGSGQFTPFINGNVGGNITRLISFQYAVSGNNGDCFFVEGDSGSPSFVVGNGQSTRPALVGMHSAVDPLLPQGTNPTQTVTSYDTYVPFYVTGLNNLLAADGYQMRPASIQAATLTISSTVTASPSPAAQKVAQSATIQINTSNREANNPTITLTFQNGQTPASITNIDGDTGWVVDQNGPTTWLLHRASIAANSNAQLKLNWNALPAASDIAIGVTAAAYNANSTSATLHLTTVQPFAAWSTSLPAGQQAMSADPDGDGRVNLLEYALGSNATQGTHSLSNGQAAGPSAQSGADFTEISVPVRTDSSARGLWYRPEYSAALTSTGWSTTAPPGTTIDFVNYAPAVPGFARMRVRLTQPSHFVRVNVALDETNPGMDVPVPP